MTNKLREELDFLPIFLQIKYEQYLRLYQMPKACFLQLCERIKTAVGEKDF